MNITLQTEYIFSLWGLSISNSFFTAVIVSVILTLFALYFYINHTKSQNILIKAMHVFIYELFKLTDMVTQDRVLSKRVLPLIATFFLFIMVANIFAMLPGFLGSFLLHTPKGDISLLRSPNSDLTITIALALISVVSIQFFSIRVLGIRRYTKRFFNFTSPIKFILGFFEILSEVVRVLSFSFRLFGNIFAGEVLLLVVVFLVPYFIPLPFMMLELFVGVIQAFVFSILVLTFVSVSSSSTTHT